jgi:hypothetical protein
MIVKAEPKLCRLRLKVLHLLGEGRLDSVQRTQSSQFNFVIRGKKVLEAALRIKSRITSFSYTRFRTHKLTSGVVWLFFQNVPFCAKRNLWRAKRHLFSIPNLKFPIKILIHFFSRKKPAERLLECNGDFFYYVTCLMKS